MPQLPVAGADFYFPRVVALCEPSSSSRGARLSEDTAHRWEISPAKVHPVPTSSASASALGTTGQPRTSRRNGEPPGPNHPPPEMLFKGNLGGVNWGRGATASLTENAPHSTLGSLLDEASTLRAK